MMSNMLTVGLSVYTKSSYCHFKHAFESIWDEQSLRPTFIFIVYDGEVPKNIESYIDQRALEGLPIRKFTLRENCGLTFTLNLMLERCQTKYFGRMDTDDISLPDRFERQIQALEDNIDLTLVGSCANDINSNGNIIGFRQVPSGHKDIIRTLPKLNPILHPSVVFRVDKLRQYGLYDVRFKTSQDYELWFRLARLGAQFMNLDMALMHYRLDDNYKSRKNLKYRLNDVRIKNEGLKKGNFPLYTYVFLILPFVVWIIPTKYIALVKKKLDPRHN